MKLENYSLIFHIKVICCNTECNLKVTCLTAIFAVTCEENVFIQGMFKWSRRQCFSHQMTIWTFSFKGWMSRASILYQLHNMGNCSLHCVWKLTENYEKQQKADLFLFKKKNWQALVKLARLLSGNRLNLFPVELNEKCKSPLCKSP